MSERFKIMFMRSRLEPISVTGSDNRIFYKADIGGMAIVQLLAPHKRQS